MKNPLINFIYKHFLQRKDLENAQAMAAYMKTTMPFYGVRAPQRRQIIKQAIKNYPIQSQKEYLEIIRELWNKPHREEKYAAIDVARAYPQYINRDSLSLFEQMIREGAWWDFVDDIAIHLIGTILMKHSFVMWPVVEQWSCDPSLWIGRTAIICQNRFKVQTDEKRLFRFCLEQASDTDFFIKKAIGWALREYAKTNPQAVYAFVAEHRAALSNLSYREACKHAAQKVLK